ncbi:glycosyltransferase 87 family protein [Actinophytocola sediminis]
MSRFRAEPLTGAAIVVSGAIVLFAAGTAGFVDLQVYRHAWHALTAGQDVYGTLPPTSTGDRLPYIYPPFGVLALSPVVALPWALSAIVMLVLSVGALAMTLYLLLGTRALVLLALPLALVAEPVWETVGFGQINLWLMALVAADCLLPKPRFARGMLVGVAAAIKVTPAAFVLFFLVRKDYRAAVTAAVTAAGVTGLSAVVAPTASLGYWLVEPFRSGGMSGSPFVTNQSIPGALSRLGVPQPASLIVFVVLAAIVTTVAVLVMRRVDAPVALVVNAAAALLVAPISWSHHWVWAIPALVLLVRHAASTGAARWWTAAACGYLIVLIGPNWFVPTGDGRELFWSPGQHLLGNNYLIVTVVLLGWALWTVRRPGADRQLVRT